MLKVFRSEQGFSLVAVLIAIAISTVALLAYNSAFKQSLNIRKSMASKQQSGDVINTIKFEVANKMSRDLATITSTAQFPIAFASRVAIGHDAALEYKLPAHYTTMLSTLQSGKALVTKDVEETLSRCANPVAKDLSSTPFYHFCLNLLKGANAPAGSFESADYGVVEFAIRPKNLSTFQGISVSDYVNPNLSAARGLEIFYNLVWSYRDSNGVKFHNRRGSFLASKP